MSRALCLLNGLALLFSLLNNLALADEPFPIEVALGRKQFSLYEPTIINRDGKFAAYAVVTPTRVEEGRGEPTDGPPEIAMGHRLYVADLAKGESVKISLDESNAWATACLVCGTDLFAAAVPVAGVFDLAGSYASSRGSDYDYAAETANMIWSEQEQGRMGKPLWDDPQRYIDNSPYFQAHRIHTPLLIIHGQADQTCPADESQKLFNSLRRLERTAQLAIYEGEGHVPAEWSRENAADLVE